MNAVAPLAGFLVASAWLAAPGLGGTARSAPACSYAAAKGAIARSKLTLPGPDPIRVEPRQAGKVICFDFTRDGRVDMAMTINSRGTAGDIGWVVFRAVGPGWKVALKRTGYKLGLVRVRRDLVETQPVYKANDPNCCPTGGFDHVRWHWNGTRFVVVRKWHDTRPGP